MPERNSGDSDYYKRTVIERANIVEYIKNQLVSFVPKLIKKIRNHKLYEIFPRTEYFDVESNTGLIIFKDNPQFITGRNGIISVNIDISSGRMSAVEMLPEGQITDHALANFIEAVELYNQNLEGKKGGGSS